METKKTNTLFITQLGILIAVELIFCFTPIGSLPITPGVVATLAHLPAIIAALLLGKKAAMYMGAVMGLSSLYLFSTTLSGTPASFAFSPFAPNGNIWSLFICLIPRFIFPILIVIFYDKLKKKINTENIKLYSAGISVLAVLLLGLLCWGIRLNNTTLLSIAPTVFWSVASAIIVVLAVLVFILLSRQSEKQSAAIIASVAGYAINSFLVLSGIFVAFRGHPLITPSYIDFIVAWGGLNAVMEIITAAIIGGAAVSRIGAVRD